MELRTIVGIAAVLVAGWVLFSDDEPGDGDEDEDEAPEEQPVSS